MNPQFQIRTGKNAGKTIEWLQQNDPSYLRWIKENRPEMLKGSELKTEQKKVIVSEISKAVLNPNMNFWNEGPHDMSKPYLKKQQDLDNNL